MWKFPILVDNFVGHVISFPFKNTGGNWIYTSGIGFRYHDFRKMQFMWKLLNRHVITHKDTKAS